VLAALLLPALSQAKERAVAMTCMGQQKQVGLAFSLYETDNDDWRCGSNIWIGPAWGDFKRWHQVFAGAGYISDAEKRVRYCPKNAQGPYAGGAYGVYDGDSSWANPAYQDRQYLVYDHDYSWYYRPLAIKAPDTYLWLGCTSAAGNWRKEFYTGCHGFRPAMFWSGGSWDQQGLWMAHGKVNGLFVDGHAQSCDGDDLLGTSNHRRITDPGSGQPGGIRAWKLKDGTGIIN
jgi:prepilin-type processing-associated H-X9-DG protein